MIPDKDARHIRTGTYLVSVIICTRNRAQTLIIRALRGLLSQKVSGSFAYEILVIDNASVDETPELVANLASTFPTISYVHESQAGLSYARNKGIAEAKGEIIAFLDDDSEPTDNWIETLIKAYEKYPKAWAIGGRAIPLCERPKPRWFGGKMLRLLGGHDFGDDDLLLQRNKYLIGCNMSFRRLAFSKIGMFRTELGRSEKRNLSHEEGELLQRMHSAEMAIYYVPSLLVYHWQPKDRLNMKSLSSVRYNSGISESWVDRLHRGLLYSSLKAGKKAASCLVFLAFVPFFWAVKRYSSIYYYYLQSKFCLGYIVGTLSQLFRPAL